jgi:hypothetical protein
LFLLALGFSCVSTSTPIPLAQSRSSQLPLLIPSPG